MARNLQTKTRELWKKLQSRNKTLCSEWLNYDTFKKDILTIEGSDLYKNNIKCNLKLKYGEEYNKDSCYFKKIETIFRDTPYEPSQYELNYLYKCINNEIDKHPNFYSYRDELKSIGNYALGKACCTYQDTVEFKYYALKCIQNDIRTFINNSKASKTVSADKTCSDDSDDYTPLLDVISCDDSFTQVNTQLALEQALNTLEPMDKSIISLSIQGYLHREIGDKVGLSESYVGRKIKKITKQLEEIFYKE